MRRLPIPPEFELILECARFPLTPEAGRRIRSLAAQSLDWSALIDMARHHQVIPLVAHGLRVSSAALPEETSSTLQAESMANARECFQCIAEISQLIRLFDQSGVELRILKGPPLAIAAFDDPALRQAGDIDLLVNPDDIERADQILRSLGYARGDEAVWKTPRRIRSYIAHQKDFEYDPPGARHPIDLHWRFYRNPWIPSNAGISTAGLEWVELSRERIPVLPLDRLFLYLSVHGALDGWLRLKWLADIGALIESYSPEELDLVVATARKLGAMVEVSAAIRLSEEWLGTRPPPSGCLGAGNAAVARILDFSSQLLVSNDCRPERKRVSAEAWFAHEWSLYGGTRARIEVLERSLFRPQLWSRISLPDPLFPLYAVLRPFEWAGARIAEQTRLLARRRLLHANISDLGLVIEALSMLLFFRVALRFASVERLVTWMGEPEPDKPAVAEEKTRNVIRRVEWAIGAIVRHCPIRFVCFPQALAAFFMLRRRRVPSRLFYGVARQGSQLKAHTWIKANDRTVVGGEAESQFTVLAIFP